MAQYSMRLPLFSQTETLSSPVYSNQVDVHPDLERIVTRHQKTTFRKSIGKPTLDAFEAIDEEVQSSGLTLIVDSGCGTGLATHKMAAANPNALVIGIDKNAARLSCAKARINPRRVRNLRFVRADLSDFWRLAANRGWPVETHYLLYPNPWPKKKQFMRRWHGHPVMPNLIRLGGRFELRTNWRIYAEEFVATLKLFGLADVRISAWSPICPLSSFEEKYLASKHALYRVQVSSFKRTDSVEKNTPQQRPSRLLSLKTSH